MELNNENYNDYVQDLIKEENPAKRAEMSIELIKFQNLQNAKGEQLTQENTKIKALYDEAIAVNSKLYAQIVVPYANGTQNTDQEDQEDQEVDFTKLFNEKGELI